jgi:hypothetical protein
MHRVLSADILLCRPSLKLWFRQFAPALFRFLGWAIYMPHVLAVASYSIKRGSCGMVAVQAQIQKGLLCVAQVSRLHALVSCMRERVVKLAVVCNRMPHHAN